MKSGADGRTKLVTSCGIWRRLKFVGNLSLSSVEPRLLGSCVGVSSWPAVQPKLFASYLLEARSCVSSDGCVPLTGEVISDARYEPVGE